MLRVDDVHFSFGSTKVLKGVTFKLRKGEILSILGPNGAGKTTLLNCICNYYKNWEGDVAIAGTDVKSLSSKEMARNVGYVPQRAIARRITVFDAILIGRRPYIEWSATEEDLEIAWDAVETMGLEHLALRYADEISGGEFQKVQIARALVQQPKIIILDEPTNNLDIYNQHMTMETIIDAINGRGISTIMSMHDINLAAQYSDSMLFLKKGTTAGFGCPDIVNKELVFDVYGLDVEVTNHEGVPFILPKYSEKLKQHKKRFGRQKT